MNTVLLRLRVFFSNPVRRLLSCIGLLFLIGLADYAFSARSARAFEFNSLKDGKSVLERRFVPRTFSMEEAVSRYVAEYLLGPAGMDCSPLFLRGTAVRSVLIRGGVAHVDLSSDAAFPAETGVDVRKSLAILIAGIERNFPSLKRAKVYIEGHEPYAVALSGTRSKESVPKKGKSVDK